MAELSKVQTRTPLRDKQLGRRDAILPTRRNQQQVRTEMSADMRTARRGDVGGAEALMRVAGQVNKAGRDFQAYDNVRWEQNERKLSQQGTIDASKGEIDEELAAENESYNRAVRMGQVRQTLAGILPKTEGAIAAAVNNQKGWKLEQRLAGVDAAIDETFVGSLVDEEGNLQDFGTAEANVYAGNKMLSVRAQARENGYAQVYAKMDDESIDNFANFAAEAVLDGEELNLDSMEAILTPTADRDKAKAAAFGVIRQHAMADPEKGVVALERLAADVDSGEGANLFDASDKVTILAILEDSSDARERQREEIRNKRYAANAEELFDLYNEGKLDKQEIMTRRDSDQISGRFARTLLNSLESDQRQREADARARRSEARAIRNEQRAIQQAQVDRELGWELIRAQAGLTDLDPVEGTGKIAVSYEERFGIPLSPSQLNQVYRSLDVGAQVRRERPEYVRYSSQLEIDTGGSTQGGFEPSPEEKARTALALDTYDTLVIGGMKPSKAYNEALKEVGLFDEFADLEARRPPE